MLEKLLLRFIRERKINENDFFPFRIFGLEYRPDHELFFLFNGHHPHPRHHLPNPPHIACYAR